MPSTRWSTRRCSAARHARTGVDRLRQRGAAALHARTRSISRRPCATAQSAPTTIRCGGSSACSRTGRRSGSELLAASNAPPPMTLRVNARRGTACRLRDAARGATAARALLVGPARGVAGQPVPGRPAAGFRRGRSVGAGRCGAARRAAVAGRRPARRRTRARRLRRAGRQDRAPAGAGRPGRAGARHAMRRACSACSRACSACT